MSFVIGIKKKLYGSDIEIEWRYASMIDPNGEKPIWSKIGNAMTFNSVEDAQKWWAKYTNALLSDKNVIADTVSVRRTTVDTECNLEVPAFSKEDQDILDRLLGKIEGDMSVALGITGKEKFKEHFLDKACLIFNRYLELCNDEPKEKEPEASAKETNASRPLKKPQKQIEIYPSLFSALEQIFGSMAS